MTYPEFLKMTKIERTKYVLEEAKKGKNIDETFFCVISRKLRNRYLIELKKNGGTLTQLEYWMMPIVKIKLL